MGTDLSSHDHWSSGDAYERYVGRWSRLVAQEFISWLSIAGNSQWLDVGCGTGALTQTIFQLANPNHVTGVDRSDGFIHTARQNVNDVRAEFKLGDAQALPVESDAFDAAISGLVLNFVSQPEQMIAEMRRAIKKNGTMAVYVWDYANKIQFMRFFWNAAAALDPAALDFDEGRRFPLCNPHALTELLRSAGLHAVEATAIDISTDFKDFDDFWTPFLGGQGSAPGYAMSLSDERRSRLRDRIYNSLPFAVDGSIPLVARAWAVKGVK